MKKKVLLLTASLLALTMLVIPVMAISPKKIPVTITRTGFSFTPAPDVWISGCVQHGRGGTRGFLNWIITGDGMPTLIGSSSAIGKYNINLENGHGAVQLKVTLTFSGGTFEGVANQRGTFFIVPSGPMAGLPQPIDGTAHAVLHGTGDYLGWTLVWTRAGGVWIEVYMLIP